MTPENKLAKPAKPNKIMPVNTAIGWAVLIALGAFVLGNRWADVRQVFTGDNQPSSQLPDDLTYTQVEELYDVLRQKYDGDLSVEQLLDGLKTGLAEATDDPYTVYLSQAESEQFLSDINGKFTGIGAELGLDDSDRLIIVAPLKGFPAEKAGMRAQDVILKINGEEAVGIKVEEAVNKIRGPEGTDVTLTILRGGQQSELTITRAEIVIPSVTTSVKDGIGILQISRFAEDTAELARQAAQEFKSQNVSGVILDLRNNSGGFLSGAVEIAELWLEDQPVVQQRRGNEVIDTQNADGGALLRDMPTVVLINEGSASASEIVAGALQDHGVATLIGVKSFGKGSVQELEKLPSGGTLKVTIARWYTPNGNNIDEEGIHPDIEVKLTEKDIENQNDRQLNRALQDLK